MSLLLCNANWRLATALRHNGSDIDTAAKWLDRKWHFRQECYTWIRIMNQLTWYRSDAPKSRRCSPPSHTNRNGHTPWRSTHPTDRPLSRLLHQWNIHTPRMCSIGNTSRHWDRWWNPLFCKESWDDNCCDNPKEKQPTIVWLWLPYVSSSDFWSGGGFFLQRFDGLRKNNYKK